MEFLYRLGRCIKPFFCSSFHVYVTLNLQKSMKPIKYSNKTLKLKEILWSLRLNQRFYTLAEVFLTKTIISSSNFQNLLQWSNNINLSNHPWYRYFFLSCPKFIPLSESFFSGSEWSRVPSDKKWKIKEKLHYLKKLLRKLWETITNFRLKPPFRKLWKIQTKNLAECSST